jgi:hypothetical protein
MLQDNEYQCEQCDGIFEKGWTDEEAKTEQVNNGWGDIDNSETALICDDCYKSLMCIMKIGKYFQENFIKDNKTRGL